MLPTFLEQLELLILYILSNIIINKLISCTSEYYCQLLTAIASTIW